MGGSRTQVNKAHKTRFASKSSRNFHKISSKDKSRTGKPDRNLTKGARAARLQRNKMMREQKRDALLKEKRASSGSNSPPRVIVLFGLSGSVDLSALEQDLLKLLSADGTGVVFPAVASSEYKLRATVADLIALFTSASSSNEEDCYIDAFGSHCLSDLPGELKKKNDSKKVCTSSLTSVFPEDCKFYPADTKDELHKFLWLFKEQRLSVPHWRNQRPYVMAQKVDMLADNTISGKCTLLSGYIHARSLSVNQLVHVTGAGDFQLSKIKLLKDPCPLNVRKGGDLMESDDMSEAQVISCLTPDPMKQEPLLVENVPDPLAGEQTWPTEAEMAEAERDQEERKLKRKTLPKGTSEYQAAWIVEDSDADVSESKNEEDDGMVLDEGESAFNSQARMDEFELDDDQASLSLISDEETETHSMMMDGENLTKEQLEDEIRKIKEAHAEDEEFPDEVDTPLDVPARKRFAKYRGLKSFRTSSWDPKESLPQEYARIFAFDNFNRTQKHLLSRAREMEQNIDESIPAGSYARLHIREVPIGVADKLNLVTKTMPVTLCGLMQHESKISVLHFSLKKHDSYTAPIKSKEEMLFNLGFCQFVARPIFSSDSFNADKQKMERFLHPGRFSVASIYAPISFPPLPLIALKIKDDASSATVAAIGSLRSIDPDRIILKKIILTGYPQRVSKLKATVRYMFHNPEDVRWFKPVEVWSKCGRRGRIKEPVGTHGAMKCILNGVLQQHDTVCMSLFKRTYPKWPEKWFPMSDA
ncbi:unnamed protein product [Withania somnifera]